MSITAGFLIGSTCLCIGNVHGQTGNPMKGGNSMKGTENQIALPREAKISSVASVLSVAITTNCSSVARIMTSEIFPLWTDFCKKTEVEGKQYFLPDFFKVKHVIIGGHDSDGFVMGLYNPFYDAIAAFLVEDRENALITGFAILDGSVLRKDNPQNEFSRGSGMNPPNEYIAMLLKEMHFTTTVFKKQFSSLGFRKIFSTLKPVDVKVLKKLEKIQKFRIGQIIQLSADKQLSARIALAHALLADSRLSNHDFVDKDPSTKTVIALLSDKLSVFRKSFQIVAYFPDGDNTNVIFANQAIRSMLVHAHISKEKRIWLKLFDMKLIETGISK